MMQNYMFLGNKILDKLSRAIWSFESSLIRPYERNDLYNNTQTLENKHIYFVLPSIFSLQ